MNGPGPDFRHDSPHGPHRARTAARRQPLAAGDAIRSFYFIPPLPPPQAQPSPPRGGFWATQPHWQFPRANPQPVPHPSSDTGRAEWPSQFEPSLPPRPPPPANLLPSASRMQFTPHFIPDPQPGLPPVNLLPPPPGGGEWPAQFRPKPNPQPKLPMPVSGPHLTASIEEQPSQIVFKELSPAPMPLPAPSRAIAATGKEVERPPQHRPPAQPVAIAEHPPAPVKGEGPEAVPVPQKQPAETSSAEQLHLSKQDNSPAKVATEEPVQPEQPVATSNEKPARLHQTARTSIEKKSSELDQIAKLSVDKPARPEERVGISAGKAAHTGSASGRRDQPVTSSKPLRVSTSRPQAASHGGVSKRAPRKGFKPESGVNYKGRGAFYGGMLGDTPESQEEMREQDAEMARRADEQRARQVKDKPWMYGEMWARGESPPPAPRRAGTGNRKQGQ